MAYLNPLMIKNFKLLNLKHVLDLKRNIITFIFVNSYFSTT